MEAVVLSSSTIFPNKSSSLTSKPPNSLSQAFTSFQLTVKLPNGIPRLKKLNTHNLFDLCSSHSSSSFCISLSTRTAVTSTSSRTLTLSAPSNATSGNQRHWMVVMQPPPEGLNSKPEIIDYYVKTLERVQGSEKDAQMCIYDASCDTHYGFCCDIDEETSRELAGLPGVISVRPDLDFDSVEKEYSFSDVPSSPLSKSCYGSSLLFPNGSSKHWVVQMDKKTIFGVILKAQMVDYFVQILTKVMANEKDAQMCIYHISWQSNFGFCCELDDECARELAGVPGVLSVLPDNNFESDNEDYSVTRSKLPSENFDQFSSSSDSSQATQSNIKTKKLFVAGLSFYTSEKTLRMAFEGFGDLVEVKIIMDKISNRSKGYAFIEYTTEEAASAALKEMNGKTINGWMIAVDIAKKNSPNYTRGQPRVIA